MSIVALLGAQLFSRALGQAPPPPLSTVIVSATQLTDEQGNQVRQYIAYWSNLLVNGSKPEDVEKGRKELTEPFMRLNVKPSLDFRGEYSRALLPELEKAIAGNNMHAAINAIIVASQLGNQGALNLLLRESDKTHQSSWQIRLQAAHGTKVILQSKLIDQEQRIVDSAKRMRDAARIEDNSLVLRHQFAAIDAADHSALPAAQRKTLRAFLLESMTDALDRIERGNNNPHINPLLESVAGSVALVREKYLENALSQNERNDLGKDVAPLLVRMMEIAAKSWETAQADPASKRLVSFLIGTSEGFLTTIDQNLRGEAQMLRTKLREAWDGGSQESFTAELAQWRDLVAKPPYKK